MVIYFTLKTMKNSTKTNRRNFLKKASLGALATISIPEIIGCSLTATSNPQITLKQDTIVLFQGDSITDAGRNKQNNEPNTTGHLGSGYAMQAAGRLLEKQASVNPKFFNKGISGNKVFQLAERWDTDCLDIKPDVLSILIGVNDIWHKLDLNYEGTVEIYKNDYIALIERTKEVLPDVTLIICEPFAVTGVRAVDDRWYPEFDEYRAAAKEVADKFNAHFIPFQTIFDEAQKRAPGSYWTYDGVHPSLAGAALMAEAYTSLFI